MQTNKIYQGDCLEILKTLAPNSIDAIVTDPPYGISFMGKKWDYDVPQVELWQEVLRVLKPGGHALVACGTRTQHRMAVNLEDAGFKIRDIIAWVYGSGLPKSTNIAIRIDKEAGLQKNRGKRFSFAGKNINGKILGTGKPVEVYEPKSKEAKQWQGWGTALKPAMELWTLCRKPIEGKTIAENVLKYGTGGINIDGSRIGSVKRFNAKAGNSRFPANLIHDGSDEVVSGFPNDSQRFFYCAKASKSERNKGLDGFEKKVRVRQGLAGEKKDTVSTNSHPTVKPVALMRYLCKLITPKGGVILDPFMGSGTTGIGAKLEGFDFIGIEREEEYCKIAEARIKAFDSP
jgi:site-specific DNA-methyltransferase (adenine-specific)